MKRREFIAAAAIAGSGAAIPADVFSAAAGNSGRPAETGARTGGTGGTQRFHQDYVSLRKGIEYYFLGNGLIQAALQTADTPEAGTHCGLFVSNPEHFCRKASTFLYHPERGTENTRLMVTANGKNHFPEAPSSSVKWTYTNDVPVLEIKWKAGPLLITEHLHTPEGEPALIRAVSVENTSAAAVDCRITALLYPNLMLFDEYEADRERRTLTSTGFAVLSLFSAEATGVGDRHLFIESSIAPAGTLTGDIVLTLNKKREEFERVPLAKRFAATAKRYARIARMETGDAGMDHLFRASIHCLRAAVAKSGKMDGSIWQYNLEWVRDQAISAMAAAMTGDLELSAAMLDRMLTRSVTSEGGTVDSSRTRPMELVELDQNGILLLSLWTHWMWSGSDALLKKHAKKIRALGSFLTRPEVFDAETGMLHNLREYWERDSAFGVKDGFEIACQAWNIRGLNCLADISSRLGSNAADAGKWRMMAERMRDSMLEHPRFSLIEDGAFIKRRLLSGEPQKIMLPPDRKRMPQGMPIATESIPYCDPDSSAVLPIVLGIVEGGSPLAKRTLEKMEMLWNQRWSGGGYGRYHAASEPDSPGPWPFPSVTIARAQLEAGDGIKARAVLDWLYGAQGGKSGAWWEFYGERPTPPLPPVGIVVWAWSEIIMLMIDQLLGVRPRIKHIELRPSPVKGVEKMTARLFIRGVRYQFTIIADGKAEARVDGLKIPLENGIFILPYRSSDCSVECHV